MMLKTSNNEFIEVPDVEVERQAKLFQSIGDTAGDFSYSFEIDNNSENLSKLDIMSPVDGFQKSVYTINDVDLCNDDGEVIYKGYLQIQDISETIEASFFSGNNNWFNMMTGKISDLDMSAYEIEINHTNIAASWANTSGVVLPPTLNAGLLGNRSTANWKLEDFQPIIYVKDVIKKCFNYSGLKLDGAILNDWRYNHLLTTSNNRGQENDRIAHINKSTPQTINDDTPELVTFENTTGIYDPGLLWNTGTNRFTADFKMRIDVDITAIATHLSSESVDFYLFKNGSFLPGFFLFSIGGLGSGAGTGSKSKKVSLLIEDGDYIEIFARMHDPDDPGTVDSATLKITPTKIYNVIAESLISIKKQIDFVIGVFKLFNTVIGYDPFTKTVTVDLFKDCIRRDEIGISEFIDPSTISINYEELISDYAKINTLKHIDSDEITVRSYNKGKDFTYGSGQIDSENDFVEELKDIVESNFISVAENNDNPFGATTPIIDFKEYEEGTEYEATVTNDAGDAKFTTTSDFVVGFDLIEVTESTLSESYKGIWMLSSGATSPPTTTFKLSGLSYNVNSTVKFRRLNIVDKDNNDQVLLLGVPSIPYASFTNNLDSITIETSIKSQDPFYCWFYKPLTGMAVDSFDESISFGPNDILNAYQRTMIEDYWEDLDAILKDPVKVYVDAYLPKAVFESITFKQPLRIKCDRFNARFFPNRITGYKDSSQPCTLQLIKLP